MSFSMTDYLQNRNFDKVSGASAQGDGLVWRAGVVGQGKLREAIDAAKTLEESAEYAGDAQRFAGKELRNASMFGGALSGLTFLGIGASKGGHFGGGGGGGDGGSFAGVPNNVLDSVLNQ